MVLLKSITTHLRFAWNCIKDMIKFKNKLIFLTSIVFLVVGIGAGYLLKGIFPTHYSEIYQIIPLYFYLLALILIYVLTRSTKLDARKITNLYMLLKYGKILFSMIFSGVILLFTKVQTRDFLMVFAGFYFIYLALETYIFYSTEKEIKKNFVDEKLT